MNRESADQDPPGSKSASRRDVESEKSVLAASRTLSTIERTNFSVNLPEIPTGLDLSRILDTRAAKAASSLDLFRSPSESSPYLLSPCPRFLASFRLSRPRAFSHYTSLRRFTMRHLYIRERTKATDPESRNSPIAGHRTPLFRDLTRCNSETGNTLACAEYLRAFETPTEGETPLDLRTSTPTISTVPNDIVGKYTASRWFPIL